MTTDRHYAIGDQADDAASAINRDPDVIAYRAHTARAMAEARALLKPGDRISRTLCGGGRGTFTMTHWRNDKYPCGRSVDDCHPTTILKVNGRPVDWCTGSPPWPGALQRQQQERRACLPAPPGWSIDLINCDDEIPF